MTPLRVLERCRGAGIKRVADRLELRVRGAGRKPFLPELRVYPTSAGGRASRALLALARRRQRDWARSSGPAPRAFLSVIRILLDSLIKHKAMPQRTVGRGIRRVVAEDERRQRHEAQIDFRLRGGM